MKITPAEYRKQDEARFDGGGVINTASVLE